MKRCIVAYATPDRQYLWPVELPDGASVGDALAAAQSLARSRAEEEHLRWEQAGVGIFGEPCDRSAIPRDGDRIEIYRALRHDPRQARRERARRGR